jgi:ParB family chromosome partitioning protein
MSNALQNSIARLGKQLDENKKDGVPLKVALDQLVPYAHQSRQTMDQDALKELAQTIREVGVIEPLLVRPLGGDRFEIIAGERRWRAARLAGLAEVPTLVRTLDDALADKVHLFENIHRENLSNLDLAQRIATDLKSANGDLAVVASKYGKSKSWVSKLSTIAQGGEVMAELVEAGATSDRAVLASVAALERKSPVQAKALGQKLKDAPPTANKRGIAEGFLKANKRDDAKASAPKRARTPADDNTAEPTWRSKGGVPRDPASASVFVEISPHSEFANEFKTMEKKYGSARLSNAVRHPSAAYAIVEFGTSALHRRSYQADELRLTAVS